MNQFELEHIVKDHSRLKRELAVVDHYIDTCLGIAKDEGYTRVGRIAEALKKAESNKSEVARELYEQYKNDISKGKFPGIDHLTTADGDYLRQRLAEEAEREPSNNAAQIMCRELRYQLSRAARWDEELISRFLQEWVDVTGNIKHVRPSATDDRTPSGVPDHHLVGLRTENP